MLFVQIFIIFSIGLERTYENIHPPIFVIQSFNSKLNMRFAYVKLAHVSIIFLLDQMYNNLFGNMYNCRIM